MNTVAAFCKLIVIWTYKLSRHAIVGTYAERGQLHTSSRSGVQFGSCRLQEKRIDKPGNVGFLVIIQSYEVL